jgi:hypothetical protein
MTADLRKMAPPEGVEIVYERDQWRFKSAWATGRLLNPEGPTYVRSDIHEASLARAADLDKELDDVCKTLRAGEETAYEAAHRVVTDRDDLLAALRNLTRIHTSREADELLARLDPRREAGRR